ncbi:MAG: S26 family signal peptidase [Burkholderiales bacterium]|nr:S26 family signal peptidase [Burkholderiales bacterium]
MRYLFLQRPCLHRFDHEAFRRALRAHVRRWGIGYLLLVVGAVAFQGHFSFGLNATPSLPHHLFLIHNGELPQRGQYVAFRWPGGGPYPAGVTFVKLLAGLPGDRVTRVDRDFYVNGIPVGTAKVVSRRGDPLELGAIGVLPAARYYVQAPHPDSLDSRYRLTGWISADQIIGRAYAIF